MKDIELSPKYGFNICMPACFWCNKTKNEVLILGKLENDAPAPRHGCFDYEPCNDCKIRFSRGVLCIEVTPTQLQNRPSIAYDDDIDLYPSGRYVLITIKAAQRLFPQKSIKNGDSYYLYKKNYDDVLSCIKNTDKI